MLNLGISKAESIVMESINQHEAAFCDTLKKLMEENSENALEQASDFYLRKITEDLSLYFMSSDFRQMNMFGMVFSSPITYGFNFDPSHLTAGQIFVLAYFIITDERPKIKSMEKIQAVFNQKVSDAAKKIG